MERVVKVEVTINADAIQAYIEGDPTENWGSLLVDDNALVAWLNNHTATAYDDVVTLEFMRD